jgi:hypothetical protein
MKRLVLCAFPLLAACAHSVVTDLVPIVKKKAAFDLACTETQLTVTELGDQSVNSMAGSSKSKSYGVDGCGKRASYSAWCTHAMMMGETCNAQQTSTPVASTAGSSN